MRFFIKIIFSLLLLSGLISGTAPGTDGICISGKLLNDDLPVPHASVVIRSGFGSREYKSITDANGNFSIRNITAEQRFHIEISHSDGGLIGPGNLEIEGETDSKNPSQIELILINKTGSKLLRSVCDSEGKYNFNIPCRKYPVNMINKNSQWKSIKAYVNDTIISTGISADLALQKLQLSTENEVDEIITILKKFPALNFIVFLSRNNEMRSDECVSTGIILKNYFLINGIQERRIKCECRDEAQLNSNDEFVVTWEQPIAMNQPVVNEKKKEELIENNTASSPNTASNTNSKVTTTVETGTVYKVQITTSGKLIPLEPGNFKGVDGVEYYIDGNIYKYTVGNFSSSEEAFRIQSQMRNQGFKDAFVVKFVDGKRVK